MYLRASACPPVRLSALLLAVLASPVRAQIIDTLPGDTTAADTVDETARFLEAQRNASIPMNVLPYIGVAGPRAPLSRIVISRDSIDWAINETLGDLLMRVPGVFLWRGGYIGRPEPVNFQARGATAAEYYLDGVPYVAAGVDSVAVDPSLFSTSFLERVEVERWPGLLRVYLFTRRHDRVAPRTWIGIARGDRDHAGGQREPTLAREQLARRAVDAQNCARGEQHTHEPQRQQLRLDRVRGKQARRQRGQDEIERWIGADLAGHKKDLASLVERLRGHGRGLAGKILEEALAHQRFGDPLLERRVYVRQGWNIAKRGGQRGILEQRRLVGHLPGRGQPGVEQPMQQRKRRQEQRRPARGQTAPPIVLSVLAHSACL